MRSWLREQQRAVATIEVVLVLIILIALVLMFKDTIVDFVAGILSEIEAQNGTFDPTAIVK